MLLILLFVLIATLIYWRRKTRLRRIALGELKKLQVSDDIVFAKELEHLLRRYAMARFGRDAVAILGGERWIAFVVEHGGVAWSGEVGTDFLRAAYGGAATPHRAAWLSGAQAFIKGR